MVDITKPNSSASKNSSFRPSLPAANVFTNATPSESNSFIASLTLSALLSTLPNASARSSICSSSDFLFNSSALIFNSCNAPLASPVPFAASASLRVNLCAAMLTVSTVTPDISAAYCNALNASVVVPILSAVFLRVSTAVKDCLINKPTAAGPAAATSAPFIENAAFETALRPDVTPLKAFLVLSIALIVILTFSAIALTHYLEIGQPLVKVVDRHLLCLCYCYVKPISQRQ